MTESDWFGQPRREEAPAKQLPREWLMWLDDNGKVLFVTTNEPNWVPSPDCVWLPSEASWVRVREVSDDQ